jgi:hypothetical protein
MKTISIFLLCVLASLESPCSYNSRLWDKYVNHCKLTSDQQSDIWSALHDDDFELFNKRG